MFSGKFYPDITILKQSPNETTLQILNLVKEGKSSEQVVKTVESRLDKILTVVTEELEGGKHSNASVLELTQLTLLHDLRVKGKLTNLEVSEETPVVNGTDEEDDLSPAKGRDGTNGSNTIGNIGTGNTRSNVEREAVDLLHNISKNGKLGYTSVLKLGSTVLIEGGLINAVRKTAGVPEAGRGDDTEFLGVLAVQGSLGDGLSSRSEGSDGGGEGGGDGELHCTFCGDDWIGRIEMCSGTMAMESSYVLRTRTLGCTGKERSDGECCWQGSLLKIRCGWEVQRGVIDKAKLFII